jgi:hypothetical protein
MSSSLAASSLIELIGTAMRENSGLATLELAVASRARAVRRRWLLCRLLLLAAGVGGLAVGAETVLEARHASSLGVPMTPAIMFYPHAHSVLMIALGWTAFAVGGIVVALPRRLALRRLWLSPALAVLPFALGLAAYLIAVAASISGAPIVHALAEQTPETPLTAGGWVGQAGVEAALALGFALSILFIWQLIEAAHVARDTGAAARSLTRRLPKLLFLALGIKLVWISLGYGGVLPPAFGGGDSSVWIASRRDGAIAWLLAVAFAAAIGLWLARPRVHAISEPQLGRGVLLLVVCLSAFTLMASAGILALPILQALPGRPLAHLDARVVGWLGDNVEWSYVGTVYGGLAVGGLLLLARRWRTTGIFLLLFGLWSLPRALNSTNDLVHRSSNEFVKALEQQSVQASWTGAVDLVTLDTALTLALVVLLVLELTHRVRVNRAGLALVLVAATLSAYSGFLSSIFHARISVLFYVGLVFPIAYRFAANAQALNEPSPTRATSLLAVVALSRSWRRRSRCCSRRAAGSLRRGGCSFRRRRSRS